MTRRRCSRSIDPLKDPTILRPYMFIFSRPFAAVFAAFATSGVFALIAILLEHAGK
jgi:hypothetical protein